MLPLDHVDTKTQVCLTEQIYSIHLRKSFAWLAKRRIWSHFICRSICHLIICFIVIFFFYAFFFWLLFSFSLHPPVFSVLKNAFLISFWVLSFCSPKFGQFRKLFCLLYCSEVIRHFLFSFLVHLSVFVISHFLSLFCVM